jgi:hypothetical protein
VLRCTQRVYIVANSSSTGHGAHGDYLFGWKGDALQRGMDQLGSKCGSEYCDQVLTIQSGEAAIACTKAQQAKEDVGSVNCRSPLNTLLHSVVDLI